MAKLGTVEEEADESAFWMELIIEGELLKRKAVESLLAAADELTKNMAKSRISASRSLKQSKSLKGNPGLTTISNRQSAIGNRQ